MPSCEVDLRAVDADDPDARGLVGAYFAELQSRLGGFDPPSKEQLRTAATRGVILVAYDANTPVACGSLRLLDEKTAEVKRMFVAPRRGAVGLVESCSALWRTGRDR